MKTKQPNDTMTVQPSTRASRNSFRAPGATAASLLALLALGLLGCQTSPFGTADRSAEASITIANHPLPQVALATDQVFLSHGYTGGRTGPDQFTYTHLGPSGSAMEKSNERALVTLKAYGDTVTVTCKAKWVENPNETGVDTRQKAWGADAKPYQELLDAIAARLK